MSKILSTTKPLKNTQIPTSTPTPSMKFKPYTDVPVNPNITACGINEFLPQDKLMDSLGLPWSFNVRRDIIAGPNPEQYWNHSPGAGTPEFREQGPFAVQGNIGALMTEDMIYLFNF